MGYRLFVLCLFLWSSSAPVAWAGSDDLRNSQTAAGFCAECAAAGQSATSGTLNAAKSVRDQACQQNFLALGCQQFLDNNPDSKDKLNYCPKVPSPAGEAGQKLMDYAAGCGKSLGEAAFVAATFSFAWPAYLVLGLYAYAKSPIELDQMTKKRQEVFRTYNTPAKKREMLGPLIAVFDKPEDKYLFEGYRAIINTDPELKKKHINCDLEEAKVFCDGYSAAMIYRELIKRVAQKSVTDKWLPPWGDQIEGPPRLKSLSELAYEKLGVRFECYDDQHKANLACNILSMILVPAGAKLVARQAAKYAGLREVEQAAKYRALAEADQVDPEKLPDGVLEAPHSTGEVGALSPKRADFIKHFRGANEDPFVWPEWIKKDNQGFIDKTNGAKPSERRLVFEIENASQKKLNDTLKRKDYVDALNNKYKDIFLRQLSALKAKYPDLEVTALSDYKGLRLNFEMKNGDKIPPDLADALGEAYTRSLSEYEGYLKAEDLIYLTDDPKLWFRSGMGTTADRASLAARYSRIVASEPRSARFEDPAVEMHIRHGFETAEVIRRKIYEQHPKLFDNVNGLKVVKAEAFDLARKISNPAELRNVLSQRYELEHFTKRDAEAFLYYVSRLNQNTPSVLTAERATASIGDSATGGFSIDLSGQGGENLRAVAVALQSLIPNQGVKVAAIETESFVQTLRRQDQIATAEFVKRKAEVSEAVKTVLGSDATVKVSGDDIVVLPRRPVSAEKQREFFKTLSERTGGNGFRATYIDASKASAGRQDALATWAESREKVLRGELEGIIPHEKLKSLIFSSSVTNGRLRFEFHYRNLKETGALNEAELRRVRSLMEKVETESRP